MKILYLRKMTLALAVGILVTAGHAQAGIVVDQSPPSPDNAYFSDVTWPQEVADNFTLTSAASPDTIKFWGTYNFANTPLNPDQFTLTFYADSNGPSSVISSIAISPTRSLYGPSNYGADIYEYTASFAPVALGAGTYWVSVVNDSSSDPSRGSQWAWEVSGNSYDSTLAVAFDSTATSSSWTVVGNINDEAFVLSTTGTAVPEPATFALAGLGAFAFVVGRRRFRA